MQGDQKPLDIESNERSSSARPRPRRRHGVGGWTAYTLPPGTARQIPAAVRSARIASNIDVNVSVGSIFSVLRAPRLGEDAKPEDFLQPGTEQVCASYAIYGPTTMLVLTVATAWPAFTLDPTWASSF